MPTYIRGWRYTNHTTLTNEGGTLETGWDAVGIKQLCGWIDKIGDVIDWVIYKI